MRSWNIFFVLQNILLNSFRKKISEKSWECIRFC
jgi:hypothetical protein